VGATLGCEPCTTGATSMPFAKRPNREPDAKQSGIQVWVSLEDGDLVVVVRKDDPKTNVWQLTETHTDKNGGEFRFERKPDAS
jgi:hypothetical protein